MRLKPSRHLAYLSTDVKCEWTAPLGTARLRPCLLFLLVSIPLVFIAYQGLPLIDGSEPVAESLAVAIVLFALTALFLGRERRSLAALGFAWSAATATKLVCGFAAGLLLFGLAALSLRGLLPFHWEPSPRILPGAIGGALLYHLATNSCEELAFRGYAFVGLIRLIGHWPAQFVTAALYALFHLLCGWPWDVALVSTSVGSLLFGLVFLRWKSVPAAVGVHAAWNWTRDLILGVPAGSAALLNPVGLDLWTPLQWQAAQAILVGVTLCACAVILFSMSGKAQKERAAPEGK